MYRRFDSTSSKGHLMNDIHLYKSKNDIIQCLTFGEYTYVNVIYFFPVKIIWSLVKGSTPNRILPFSDSSMYSTDSSWANPSKIQKGFF